MHIGEKTTIARGCLVGDGVILGAQARLGEFDRVSKRRDEGDEDEDGEEEDEDEEDEESEDSELEDAESRKSYPDINPSSTLSLFLSL